jgi:hypothetical protein
VIDFRVNYWDLGEYPQPCLTYVSFDGDNVEVVVTSTYGMTRPRWDEIRLAMNSSTYVTMHAAYGGTPLHDDLLPGTLGTEAMNAFAALHLLVPDAAGVADMEKDLSKIPARYDGKVFKDAMGNPLRIVRRIAVSELRAAEELMQHGLLQALTVTVTGKHGASYEYRAFFEPFSMPNAPTSDLSREASELRNSFR